MVEKRPRGSPNWVAATSSPVVGTSVNIGGLPTDGEFEFRVIPINAAGPGEPSQPTPMTKIQDKRGKTSLLHWHMIVTKYSHLTLSVQAGAASDFITKLSPATSGVGGTVEFVVQVDGHPPPKVRWLRNGVELSPAGRIRTTGPDDDGFARLTLSDINEHDAGDITCELVTPVNRVSCSAPLDVFGAPRILGDVPDRTAEEGEFVKFKVPYSAKGTIALRLRKDGREVPEGNGVKLLELDGVASVQFKGTPSL